jgi:hypothetical protein
MTFLILAALGIAFFVWRKKKSQAKRYPPLAAKRQHAWELTMTDAEEAALLRGLVALKAAGHDSYVDFQNGLIHFYSPDLLVSADRLASAFKALGTQAIAAPGPALAKLFADFKQGDDGSLVLSRNWYQRPLPSMDAAQFVAVVDDVTNRSAGYAGSSSDDQRGYFVVHLETGNSFCVALGTVVASIDPSSDVKAQVKRRVAQLSAGGGAGSIWARQPTLAEQQGIASAN